MNIREIRIVQEQKVEAYPSVSKELTALDYVYYSFSEDEILEILKEEIERRNGNAELQGFEAFEYEIDKIEIK